MNNSTKNKGFGLFAVLVAVAIVAIIGVVLFVALKPKVQLNLPTFKYTPATTAAPAASATPTPLPDLSPSQDDTTINKELQDTQVQNVEVDFNQMNSSASSL